MLDGLNMKIQTEIIYNHLGLPKRADTAASTGTGAIAKSLKENKICFSESQKKFDLATAIKEHGNYSGFTSYKQKVDWKKLFGLF